MEQIILLVFAKNGKIKVLNLEKAKKIEHKLLEKGWVHTQTLDPCLYIQYLHNDCDKFTLIEEIKSLTTT